MNSTLKYLIPEEFRPLLNCISPSAFRVVDWKAVLKFAPTLSKRAVGRVGVVELARSLSPFLPEGVRVEPSDVEGGFGSRSDRLGSLLLQVYFAQLYCPAGLFLDLRKSNFSASKDGSYQWKPNGLWVQLENEFRQGMIAIYEGYYLGNQLGMREGLLKVGLVSPSFPEERSRAVEAMLLTHLGGNTKAQAFRIKDFISSFEKLFQFLSDHQISLKSDFLFLGIYLASLYLHLEELGGVHDVESAFLLARGRALPA